MTVAANNLTIKLFATFQKGRFAVENRDYPDNTTVEQIVDDLHIPKGEVGVLLMNNRHVDFDTRPQSGDVLAIFPVIGGG